MNICRHPSHLRHPCSIPNQVALLVLTALLAACAQPAPAPTPAPAPLPASSSAPNATPRPTTVEVDPTEAPTSTPAPAGDCPATFDELDAVDRAMFAGVTAINDVFIDRRFMIWDAQYRFYDLPIVMARRDTADVPPRYGFLFNRGRERPDNAGVIELPTYLDLGTVYCISPLVGERALSTTPHMLYQPLYTGLEPITDTMQTTKQISDRYAFLLIYGDRSKQPRSEDRLADPRAVERWISYAVREAFGRWQTTEGFLDGRFRPAASEPAAQAAPPTKEQIALALLEQRILAAALRAAGSDERLLRELVAVRQLRLAQYPAATQDEQAREQGGGTAEYVADRFATAAGQAQLQSWPERLLASYAGDRAPTPEDGIAPIDRYMREERPVLMGAALCVLMDAAAIPWRPMMAEGKTPFDALAAAVPVADGEREALAQQARDRFNYAELEARAEAALAALGGSR